MTDKPRQQTRTQYAYDQLKAMIMDNSLAAGASFLEQTLAERLGVSRTPLREAAQQLQTEGFVTIRPRLGVLIRPISARDMAEIYDLLTVLEPHAARLLAQRDLGPECRAELQGSVFEMDHALRAMDLKAWALADRAFHKRLIDDLATSIDEHRALRVLISKGDADGAETLHREHRARAGAALTQILKHHGGAGL